FSNSCTARSTSIHKAIYVMPRSLEPVLPSSDDMAPNRSLCDVFVKIGGSILDHDTLSAALVPKLIESARQQRALILTGGGQTAKRIKANQRRHGHELYRFWRATGLLPEVNAYLLASYSPDFAVVSCAAEIISCRAAGHVPIFAPAGAILNSMYFLPDWLV